jgi:Na+-translocating ferredoxin:NAD+ oxidoreductase RnfC subunit
MFPCISCNQCQCDCDYKRKARDISAMAAEIAHEIKELEYLKKIPYAQRVANAKQAAKKEAAIKKMREFKKRYHPKFNPDSFNFQTEFKKMDELLNWNKSVKALSTDKLIDNIRSKISFNEVNQDEWEELVRRIKDREVTAPLDYLRGELKLCKWVKEEHAWIPLSELDSLPKEWGYTVQNGDAELSKWVTLPKK